MNPAAPASNHSAPRWLPVLFVVLLLLVTGLLLLTGPVPQVMFAPDVINLLDGAQRQALGQAVHRDFYSPLGGVAFLPFSCAMRFTGATASALPVGVALNFLVLTVWAWTLARARLVAAPAAVFTAMIGLLAAATYALGFGEAATPSYAMYYNRTGWALLGLVALEVFVPPSPTSHLPAWLGAASTGVALAGLLLLKVNFFVAALGLVASAAVVQPARQLRHLLATAAAFIAAVLVAVALARIDLVGYVREIVGMARSVTGDAIWPVLPRIIDDNTSWLVACAVVAACVTQEAWSAQGIVRASLGRAVAAFLLVVAAGLFVSTANCQFDELPTFPLGLLILAALLRDQPASQLKRALGLAAIVLCLLSCVPHAGMLARAAARRTLLPADAPANGLRLDSSALAALGLRGWPDEPTDIEAAESIPRRAPVSPLAFGQWLQDGLRLLRPHVSASSRVICLDWANPFPFALGLAPVRGDHIAWHVGRVVGDRYHPDAAALAGAADFVLEPRASIQPDSLAFKKRLFDPLLADAFAPVATSRYWILWQRHPAAPAASSQP